MDRRWANKGQDMNYKYNGIEDFEGFILECDVPLEKWKFGTEVNINLYQPDRLRRVDTSNSEAIVGSANINEIAEAYRNDLPSQ